MKINHYKVWIVVLLLNCPLLLSAGETIDSTAKQIAEIILDMNHFPSESNKAALSKIIDDDSEHKATR